MFLDANRLINDLEAQFGRSPSRSWYLTPDDLKQIRYKWNNLPCQSEAVVAGIAATPAEEYMNEYVLGLSNGIGFSLNDPIRWQNTLIFLLSWALIFCVLMKGLKEAGKIIWFTALFPYLVLTIFLIRAATLEGASDGVSYYIGPKSEFSKLLIGSTWQKAATQILFSLAAAQGGLITLSSFTPFKNDNLKDSLIICTGMIS